jgi:hypothetical protein
MEEKINASEEVTALNEQYSDESIYTYWKRKNCFGAYLEGLCDGSKWMRGELFDKLAAQQSEIERLKKIMQSNTAVICKVKDGEIAAQSKSIEALEADNKRLVDALTNINQAVGVDGYALQAMALEALKSNAESKGVETKSKIMDDIEAIQDKVNAMGFKGQNEYDLHLRYEIADYILTRKQSLTTPNSSGRAL